MFKDKFMEGKGSRFIVKIPVYKQAYGTDEIITYLRSGIYGWIFRYRLFPQVLQGTIWSYSLKVSGKSGGEIDDSLPKLITSPSPSPPMLPTWLPALLPFRGRLRPGC